MAHSKSAAISRNAFQQQPQSFPDRCIVFLYQRDIFQNGASMNIQVEINGNTILCTQSGKSNASYFPELPREVALVAAMDADPITWTMTLQDDATLIGTKQTLQAITDSGTAVGAEMGTTTVTWKRQ